MVIFYEPHRINQKYAIQPMSRTKAEHDRERRKRRFVPKGERRRRRFYAQEEAAERGMMVHRAHGHLAGMIPE